MTEKLAYLAGGITGLSDQGQAWRQAAIDMTPAGWRFINPFTDELRAMTSRDLVNQDLSWILSCRAIIVRLNQPSWGTGMEIITAFNHQVHVIGWNAPKIHSIWLDAHVNIFRFTLRDAIKELNNV